jgi:hypothetical protein
VQKIAGGTEKGRSFHDFEFCPQIVARASRASLSGSFDGANLTEDGNVGVSAGNASEKFCRCARSIAEGRWTPRYETFPFYQSPLPEFSKEP